jgi:uncharacterized membrane protein
MSFMTLIALIAVGQFHHNADPGGTNVAPFKTGNVSDYLGASGQTKVHLSQSGINALANEVGPTVEEVQTPLDPETEKLIPRRV